MTLLLAISPLTIPPHKDEPFINDEFKVCRICLTTEEEMYHISDHGLRAMYEQLTGSMNCTEDKLPEAMCPKCADGLLAAHNLREMALRTIEVLMYKYKNEQMEQTVTLNDTQPITNEFNIMRNQQVPYQIIPKNEIIIEFEKETLNENDEDEQKPDINVNLSKSTIDEEIIISDDEAGDDVKAANEVKDENNDEMEYTESEDDEKVEKIDEVQNNTNKTPAEVKNKRKGTRQKVQNQGCAVNELEGFTVTELSHEEQVAEIENRKQSDSYKEAPFKCELCFKGFNIQVRYENHMEVHDERSGAFQCPICKRRYKQERSLKTHLSIRHHRKFECKSCSFVSNAKAAAEKHKNFHSGRTYDCPHCESKFNQITTYLSHLKVKHLVCEFVCEWCGYTFVNQHGLRVHKNFKHRIVHEEELKGPFCEKCDVKFAAADAYDRHLKLSSKHNNELIKGIKPKDQNPIENDFIVTELSHEEQVAEIEKRKESDSYTEADFKCELCYKGFDVKSKYEEHMEVHDERSGAFLCPICKRRFKKDILLKKHRTTRHNTRFECKSCSFVSNAKSAAENHRNFHAGRTYDCPHCDAKFNQLTTYKGHLRLKHVCEFVCEWCGYTYVSQRGLRAHKNMKHRWTTDNVELKGPYCEECDVTFATDDVYFRHLELSSKHTSNNETNRPRNTPNKIYQTGKPVRKDEGALKTITCEQCGTVIQGVREYRRHFKEHHFGVKRTQHFSKSVKLNLKHICETCGRRFAWPSLLEDHQLTHTGVRRYECEECGKTFVTKLSLTTHIKSHTAVFECLVCEKTFNQLSNRDRHMLIHQQREDVKCDYCDKLFKSAALKKVHIDHVHLKKPWPKRNRYTTK